MVAVLAARIKLGWQVEQTSLQNTDQLHVMVPTKFWAWHLHHKILCPTPSLAATPLNGQLPWQVSFSTRKIRTSEILILFSDWNGNVDNSSAGYERKHTDMDGAHEMRRVRDSQNLPGPETWLLAIPVLKKQSNHLTARKSKEADRLFAPVKKTSMWMMSSLYMAKRSRSNIIITWMIYPWGRASKQWTGLALKTSGVTLEIDLLCAKQRESGIVFLYSATQWLCT